MKEVQTHIQRIVLSTDRIPPVEASGQKFQAEQKPKAHQAPLPPSQAERSLSTITPEKLEKLREQTRHYLASLTPKEREAREARLRRRAERFEQKIVASREEVDTRLAAENLPPITDKEWKRILREDAYRQAWKEGHDVPVEVWQKELAEEKAEHLRRKGMTDAQREQELQRMLEENRRIGHIKNLAATTTPEWESEQQDRQAHLNRLQEIWKTRYAEANKQEGDSRFDPMTGDLLKPDELPLDAAAEYLLTGKSRPRRFIPPGSPFLNNGYKPVRSYEGEPPESEKTERHIKRLLKAGFVEVEPVGSDWRFFAFQERLRAMSPYEIARDWEQYQTEARERMGLTDKSVWEILGEIAVDLFDLFMRLLLGLPPVEDEKTSGKTAHNSAAPLT